jgi:hypothetical protein
LHHLGIGAERRRTLRRVEHAEPTRGARADVEQAPACTERPLGALDRARDRVALRRDSVRDAMVLGVDQINDL